MKRDVWLMGEAAPLPFASQLVAVYSYVPMAILLQTSLITGPIYAHEPVKIASNGSTDWKVAELPFSAFFDEQHFHKYWAKHDLKVISARKYQQCFERSISVPPMYHNPTTRKMIHFIRNVTRIPEFYPIDRNSLEQFIFFANTSSFDTFNFPFDNHRFVKLRSRFGFVAMFSFWKDLDLLQNVHNSIRPAKPLASLSNMIVYYLNRLTTANKQSGYLAVHIRVDDVAFDQPITSSLSAGSAVSATSTGLINEELHEHEHHPLQRTIATLIQFISQHPCHQQYGKDMTIYLVTNIMPTTKQDRKRTKKIIEMLHDQGYTRVLTRKHIVEQFLHRNRTLSGFSNSEKPNTGGTITEKEKEAIDAAILAYPDMTTEEILKIMTPEQLQYVDLLVSQKSKCFIPSMVPSVQSYLTIRLRGLDQGLRLNYQDVNSSSFGSLAKYREWGL